MLQFPPPLYFASYFLFLHFGFTTASNNTTSITCYNCVYQESQSRSTKCLNGDLSSAGPNNQCTATSSILKPRCVTLTGYDEDADSVVIRNCDFRQFGIGLIDDGCIYVRQVIFRPSKDEISKPIEMVALNDATICTCTTDFCNNKKQIVPRRRKCLACLFKEKDAGPEFCRQIYCPTPFAPNPPTKAKCMYLTGTTKPATNQPSQKVIMRNCANSIENLSPTKCIKKDEKRTLNITNYDGIIETQTWDLTRTNFCVCNADFCNRNSGTRGKTCFFMLVVYFAFKTIKFDVYY